MSSHRWEKRAKLIGTLAVAVVLFAGQALAGSLQVSLMNPVIISDPQGNLRVLVRAGDLSAIQGTLVTRAFFEFSLPGAVPPAPLEVQLYAIARDWDPAGVTWTAPWTTPGGDVDAEFFGFERLEAGSSATGLRVDVTPMVRAIVRGEKLDHGFVVTRPRARGVGLRAAELTALGGLTTGVLKVEFLRTVPRGWRTG